MSRRLDGSDDYHVAAFVQKGLLDEDKHNPGSILQLAMLSAADMLSRAQNPSDLEVCANALATLANAASKHQSDKTSHIIAALLAFRDAPDVELPPPIPGDEGIIGEVVP